MNKHYHKCIAICLFWENIIPYDVKCLYIDSISRVFYESLEYS